MFRVVARDVRKRANGMSLQNPDPNLLKFENAMQLLPKRILNRLTQMSEIAYAVRRMPTSKNARPLTEGFHSMCFIHSLPKGMHRKASGWRYECMRFHRSKVKIIVERAAFVVCAHVSKSDVPEPRLETLNPFRKTISAKVTFSAAWRHCERTKGSTMFDIRRDMLMPLTDPALAHDSAYMM